MYVFFCHCPQTGLGVQGVMGLKQLDCEVTQVHVLLRLRMSGAIIHHFPISS
jgi:hypothetical protein